MARILVVEDEPELQTLIVDEVEDMGHEVFLARNGEEALDVASARHPHLILSDVNMPKMNGHQLRRELANNHAEPDKLPSSSSRPMPISRTSPTASWSAPITMSPSRSTSTPCAV